MKRFTTEIKNNIKICTIHNILHAKGYRCQKCKKQGIDEEGFGELGFC